MTDFSPREIVSELDRYIVGQHDALHRALTNVLLNAVDATHGQGRVVVRVAATDGEVRLVFVRGSGPVFCAGADVKERAGMTEDQVRARRMKGFAAYEALDEATRRRVAGLSAHHSLYHSQAKIGHIVQTGTGYGFHTKGEPLRPLVKVHPVTGRPALFIGRHAHAIPGLDEAESEKLLSDLLEFACRPPRTYGHRWQPGDVVIWDNRCVLHRARPYDYRQARVMRHTRVAGDPATELAPTDRDERAAAYEPSPSNR